MLENPSFVHVVVTIHSLRGGVTTLSHLQKKKRKENFKAFNQKSVLSPWRGLETVYLGLPEAAQRCKSACLLFSIFLLEHRLQTAGTFRSTKARTPQNNKTVLFFIIYFWCCWLLFAYFSSYVSCRLFHVVDSLNHMKHTAGLRGCLLASQELQGLLIINNYIIKWT